MFRLAILRSQSFGWQFCEAHCLQWQIANFLLDFGCHLIKTCQPWLAKSRKKIIQLFLDKSLDTVNLVVNQASLKY